MEARRLDAILPLAPADAARAGILFRSLETFLEPLRTCFVVAPDDAAAAVRPHVPAGRYELVPESELVPELPRSQQIGRMRARLRVGAPAHGWHVQQLVKLAAPAVVGTDFFLTLDADVICIRPTSYEDLVVGGRAVAQITPPHHPEWNDRAEEILRLPRSGRQHGVTPAVLSRAAVVALQEHLGRGSGQPWRRHLLRSLPWTEYSLYHTFLEGVGAWDEHHVDGGETALYGNSVWIEGQWPEWDPARSFDPRNDFCFSVVQSATRIPPEAVWRRVAPYLEVASRGSAPAGAAAGS